MNLERIYRQGRTENYNEHESTGDRNIILDFLPRKKGDSFTGNNSTKKEKEKERGENDSRERVGRKKRREETTRQKVMTEGGTL